MNGDGRQTESKLTFENIGEVDEDGILGGDTTDDGSSVGSISISTIPEDDIDDDYEHDASMEENILLNKEHLTRFLQSFCCSSCRAPVKEITYKTTGIATRVSYSCYRCKRKELLQM